MDAYTSFAKVYDMFMDDVPYEAWADYIGGLLAEHGILDGLVLDLGCGTGSMTEALAARGYDMIGVDSSSEMLDIAARKRGRSGSDILYLQQDMCGLELYGTVGAVVSVCDCVNYVTEESELIEVFRLVNNYLDPGGIFVFDFNTEYKYKAILGEQTIAEDREDGSFIWDNYYDEEEKINAYELTLFIRDKVHEGLYRKYKETHFQRAYTLREMKGILERAGLAFIAAYDAYEKRPPHEESERICMVAREKGKGLT